MFVLLVPTLAFFYRPRRYYSEKIDSSTQIDNVHKKAASEDTPTANWLKKEVSLGLPKVGKDKEANLLSSTLQNKAIKLI